MMLRTAALLSLAALVAPAPAMADDATIACLQSKLIVSDVKLAPEADLMTRYFTFKLTNKLRYAVAGLYIRTVVKSPNRSVPWVDSTMSFDIAGGVEPGETRTIKGFGLSMVPEDMPKDVALSISVLDAADQDRHPISGDVQFMDWPGKSTRACS